VKEIAEELVAQANHAAEDGRSDANGVVKVPPELRKAKVAQVMSLLEREFVTPFHFICDLHQIGQIIAYHSSSILGLRLSTQP
jgi:hypothetical protein